MFVSLKQFKFPALDSGTGLAPVPTARNVRHVTCHPSPNPVLHINIIFDSISCNLYEANLGTMRLHWTLLLLSYGIASSTLPMAAPSSSLTSSGSPRGSSAPQASCGGNHCSDNELCVAESSKPGTKLSCEKGMNHDKPRPLKWVFEVGSRLSKENLRNAVELFTLIYLTTSPIHPLQRNLRKSDFLVRALFLTFG